MFALDTSANSAMVLAMKETSKAVRTSRAKTGVTSTSFAFTPAEKAEIDAWADELGVSRKEAILEAVRAARRQGKMTNKQLLAEIERRLK